MSPVINVITRNRSLVYPIVPFDASRDKLATLDLTSNNLDLTDEIFTDTGAFTEYIDRLLASKHARYLIGGYNEHRMVYSRSPLFLNAYDGIDEPRCIHLGIDIWGAAGTPVFAPLGGMVHSFAFNDHYGDYGATIILSHQLEAISFYTLYGHLSLADLRLVSEGQYISAGSPLAHFGTPAENGHWPPHLHFQLITEIGVSKGDYPGVCRVSEREKYISNSPDPAMLIQFK
ncbi:MAG TPA: peptidoglycan DD-metalloendopeptidase family protein [Flavitalea sp.]|nr:peptidoglycan DD-metalloendopeptidase family protein [Flavitalea sp.]